MTRIIPTRAACLLSRFVVALLVLGAMLLGTSAADAALTTGKCLVLKRQAWGNLRKCETAEQVKRLKGKPADLAKCQTKFQERLAKITTKAADAAIACRYGDNGDRTVTDYDTGLQWEKKSGRVIPGFDGFFCLNGDAHCVNDTYTWDETNSFVDATSTGTTLTSCFFGHCDWRLPTVVELQTILLEPLPCGTSPCIDPIFGPTLAGIYWSATSDATGSDLAWLVYFDRGFVGNGNKGNDLYVRAVRAGL